VTEGGKKTHASFVLVAMRPQLLIAALAVAVLALALAGWAVQGVRRVAYA
jgi:hypothetical protein